MKNGFSLILNGNTVLLLVHLVVSALELIFRIVVERTMQGK
jgi:hypothetical protein